LKTRTRIPDRELFVDVVPVAMAITSGIGALVGSAT
jgi:hypothetical protein